MFGDDDDGDDGDGDDYDYYGDNTGYDIDDITFIIEMVNYCMICFYSPPFFSMFKFRNWDTLVEGRSLSLKLLRF